MHYLALTSLLSLLLVLYVCLYYNFEKDNLANRFVPLTQIDNILGQYSNHSLIFPYNGHHFNCTAILTGNLAEIRRAERYVDVLLLKTRNWSKLLLKTHCDDMVYDFYPTSDEEVKFPLAFGIIAYKNPVQLLKLLRTIYRPWNYYCVHLDTKSKDMEPLVEKLQFCFPNLKTPDRRENIKWGEINLLKGALNCMNKLYSNATDWKYYLNIAGSDFPLKTNFEIVRYLRNLNFSSDIQDLGDDDGWKYKYSFKNGITKKSLDELKHALKNSLYYPTKSPIPENLHIHKGSFSGVFERKFVRFIVEDDISLKLLRWLNDTFIPDEAYWSTLYHGYYKFLYENNIWNSSTKQFLTRYTHWGDNKPRCSGYNEHGLCVYGLYDLRWLLKKPHLFGHKFDETVQPVTIDCLESFIRNQSVLQSQ